MKFTKRPVEIEALQWTGENHRDMYNFLSENNNDYIQASGENFYIDHSRVADGLIIKTLEGEHIASIGDWIIKGVKGEYYPCKPDIFELTYDTPEASRSAIEAEVMADLEDRWLQIDSKSDTLVKVYPVPNGWQLAIDDRIYQVKTILECIAAAEQAQKGGKG